MRAKINTTTTEKFSSVHCFCLVSIQTHHHHHQQQQQQQHRSRKSSSSGSLPQGSQSTTTTTTTSRTKSDRSSVKSEPLDQNSTTAASAASSYYSSHFAGSKSLHDSSSSVLHGLPQLTPAPFSSHSHHHHQHHYHQGFSLNDDVKYGTAAGAGAQHHHSSLPYQHHGYGSFHSASNGVNSSGMFYTGLPEHSSKLNLQAS